ncbi:hypothetical protein [Fusobacterium sp.]|uniref:hypothetical protein n=1 Tax=Fusobacterium sp. TaxID=68766 RepID=UPI0025BBB218|nr:hypothetical protein [Fusobacterium sp.]
MKIFVYLLIAITSLLIILMNIFKLFLGFICILGYLFIFGLIIVSLIKGTVEKKDLINFGFSSAICFGIFYGYFAILEFLIGFKGGLIESLNNK